MGQQQGVLQLQGTGGAVTFRKLKTGGYQFGAKRAGITKEDFLNSPAFQKQRDHAAEFSSAGKAVKLLRRVFHEQILTSKDSRLTPRMQKVMLAVTKADGIHGRGMRIPAAGPLELLEKFECNAAAPFLSTLNKEVEADFDRPTGKATLSVPGFIPARTLKYPLSSTNYHIVLAAAEVDFETEDFFADAVETIALPIGDLPADPLNLVVEIPANSTKPVFVMVGIRFSEVVNGFEYPDMTGDFNALYIAKVAVL